MSLSTLTTPGCDGWDDDLEFEAIVADFDQPTFRPSRAAVRREAREQIERDLGIRRHRSREREV